MDGHSFELLKTIVDINSGTGHLKGCDAVRSHLRKAFESVGYGVRITEGPGGHKLFVAEAPGAKPDIALIGHLDTVFPVDSAFQRFIDEGERLIGPGVIDMKGGLVLIHALVDSLRNHPSYKRIRVLINDDEENGSHASKELLHRECEGIRYGLVFEPGLPDGALVTAHAGVKWIELTVHGRPAHAGLEPEKGVNACVELSHKITKIARLNNFARRLYVSPNVVSGGTTTNVICENASVKIDVRYVDKSDLDHVLLSLRQISMDHHLEASPKPSSEMRVLSDLPSMPESTSAALFKWAKEAGKDLGQTVNGRAVGYASDANHLAEREGMNLLVGLGPYGEGMHTDWEYMLRSSFAERLRLCTELLKRIA